MKAEDDKNMRLSWTPHCKQLLICSGYSYIMKSRCIDWLRKLEYEYQSVFKTSASNVLGEASGKRSIFCKQ